MKNKLFALALSIVMLLLCAGCKSEEQIAQGVQSTSGIRDVVYNEAPEVVKRTIVVTGKGEITTVPDTANISFNINTKEKEATVAQSKNEEIVLALLATLQSDGIAEKDIRTASISLYEQYDYSKSEPVLTGYEASSRVEATIREVENLGAIIAHALEVGVTNYDGLSFSATDTQKAYGEALAAAVKDAQDKAETIASAAEKELTGLLTIEEQSISQSMAYDSNSRMMDVAATDAAASGSSISTGEIKTVASVTVTYEIN